MIEGIFGKKKKRPLNKSKKNLLSPTKELVRETVSSSRFNDMIDYYTHELKTRLDEIEALQAQNEVVMKTALKQGSRNDERARELAKLREDNKLLNDQIIELKQRLKEANNA